MTRALTFFASHGITVERVMTDNHRSYRQTFTFAAVLADSGIKHVFVKPHCPWTNGEVERFNRTLQHEWAYRRPLTSNTQRRRALARWLQRYNHRRRHLALGAHPPISQVATT